MTIEFNIRPVPFQPEQTTQQKEKTDKEAYTIQVKKIDSQADKANKTKELAKETESNPAVKIELSERARQMASGGSAGAGAADSASSAGEAAKDRMKEEIKRLKEEISKIKNNNTLSEEEKQQKLQALQNQLMQIQTEYAKAIQSSGGNSGSINLTENIRMPGDPIDSRTGEVAF